MALIAAAFLAGAQPARADTISAIETDDLSFFDDGTGDDRLKDGVDWFDEPGDGWLGEEWAFEEYPEEYLVDYDDLIAGSGLPLDDDGMMYTTGDWVKRGEGAPAPVPLPGAGLLLLGGLAGLAAVRRRRRG